ncbi:MAG: glycosyltransferase family 4 protein [Candidatus Aureabacteria bacterium]|nr:glycosyltransferase family 4 protein [Candidatus Auribacterota bacterium]
MKVLVLSHLFPHSLDPSKNVFIEEQVKFLSKKVETKVISPIPYFPPLKIFKSWYRLRGVEKFEIRNGIEIFRPRYLIFPRGFLYAISGLSYFLAVIGLILRIRRKYDFQVIHAHFAYPDGFAGVLIAKLLKKKIIVTLHGPDVSLRMKNRFLRKLILYALKRCDKIISVSNQLKAELVKYGVDDSRITIIHNGVDMDIFRPLGKEDLFNKLDVSSGKKRILYVGYIIKAKGVPDLLSAMEIVRKEFPDAELVLIGGATGTAWEKECREIKSSVTQNDLKEAVRFIGKVNNEKIPFWMNIGDVLVLPSLFESFGVVLIEALSCGTPVISTYCGGPEDIINEKVGILVPVRDVRKLAEAIKSVLVNKYKYEPNRLRQYVKENFDYNVISGQIVRLYEDCLFSNDAGFKGKIK